MKQIKNMFIRSSGVLLVFFTAASFSGTRAADRLTSEITPNHIPVTIGYHGTSLTVKGRSDGDTHLLIKITNKSRHAELKYKAKVGGIVWMKKGKLTFKNLPDIYMLFGTKNPETLLTPAELKQYHIGYKSLIADAKVEDEQGKEAERKWLQDFISFKEHDGLYLIKNDAIQREQGGNFKLVIDWPFQAGPDKYTVETFAVREGRIIDRTTQHVEVERSGLIAALSGMAFEHPALYGIMAVIVAMVAGFSVGTIFKKGGGGGH